jgi:hypothetical protein
MTEEGLKGAARATEERLPRRDRILLPCVFFGTVILLGGGAELVARLVFTQSQTGIERCTVLNDATTGVRGIPNSVCFEKSPESANIEFNFNKCGHRAGMECGPKPAHVYRIVMTGSSLALGERVQQQESFAALLPTALSLKTGRSVELYNESMFWGYTHSVTLRFNDVLAARPDLILWILTPVDVERSFLVLPSPDEIGQWKSKSLSERIWLRLNSILASEAGKAAITDLLGRSRATLMLRHFLYQSQSLYVNAALAGLDNDAGFFRDPMSALWKEGLKQVDSDAATIGAQASNAGVPFAAVYVPNRAQSAMVSMGQWPTGIDPYKLDGQLRLIIESHGGKYIDLLPEFRAVPNPERFYFPVDGHPNPEGHALLTKLLAKELTSGVVPTLTVNKQMGMDAVGSR